jgi:hypothetical protein
VIEYPATLESRLFGESKMKVVRTIGRHLDMLGRLARVKLSGESLSRPGAPAVPAVPTPARWRRSTPPPALAVSAAQPPEPPGETAP